MQSVNNGLQLGYEDFGSGPTVVLMHGFPLRRQMWRPQVEPLVAAGFRVILPDLRGFGESAAVTAASMDDYADDLIALLDNLQIDTAVIGGMSMGGYVLLNLLERYPQRFRAALFIVTRAAADDAAGKNKRNAMIAAVEGGDRDLVPDSFAQVLFATETLSEQPQLVSEVRRWMQAASPAGLVAALAAMRDRKDYCKQLQQFTLPSLVLGGSEDRTIPTEHFDLLTAGLPNATSVLIQNGGHMVNLECSETFNTSLVNFLQQL
jgi:pimeloyl-ACP methyl ester carboxylesterase